ncbi:hypothetical protein TNCV_1374201 [Trichonephila clavipes]|nr:hypothetical protein TNCV_1374201 [Trichonephila clavipes]
MPSSSDPSGQGHGLLATLSHEEFRGLRSDFVRQVALVTTTVLAMPVLCSYSKNRQIKRSLVQEWGTFNSGPPPPPSKIPVCATDQMNQLSCSNLDSDEDIRLSESDCEESEESAVTATAGSDIVQSERPIFDDFFQHLWPYIGNNTANVVFQMVKRLWLIRIDQ